ncbi:MAG: diguanylate cyclase [Deltaproteobacteria bacterium]|nr:diguanylate cyclase [Deltaproteobacteria bacterium]
MTFPLSIRVKLFLSHLLAILLVSGSIGAYFYLSAAESLLGGIQERLESSAAILSRTIDAKELREIRGAADAARPSYLRNLELLRTFRRMNADIAYLYIMRHEGDKVLFVIDSDESNRQALPGREYNAAPTMVRGFTSLSVDEEIDRDEWGYFLSGYAPLANGAGEYLIGIDMRADEVYAKYRRLRIAGLSSLAASVLLALLFGWWLARRFVRPIRLFIDRCHAVAEGRLDEEVAIRTNDEMDQLVVAFNGMQSALASSERERREAYDALLKARDELEIRVEQRTADLREAGEKLNREIAERMRVAKVFEESAMTDPLTGVPNRRTMADHMQHEIVRSRRGKTPLTILMLDLDHFKKVNDEHGHDAGDKVLIEAGRRMKELIRGQDLLARWGGEEFIILLPETPLAGGMIVAEKIRRRVAGEPFAVSGAALHVTLSIGVATLAGDQQAEEMIKSADMALYAAKQNGRNRVEAAS